MKQVLFRRMSNEEFVRVDCYAIYKRGNVTRYLLDLHALRMKGANSIADLNRQKHLTYLSPSITVKSSVGHLFWVSGFSVQELLESNEEGLRLLKKD